MNIKKAVLDHLRADGTVTTALGTHDFGSGTQPAIYMVQHEPQNVTYPAAFIHQVTAEPFDVRERRGQEVFIDVEVFDNKDISDQELYAAARALWDSLHRADLTIPGGCAILCIADPPVELVAGDDNQFPGYVVRCRILGMEN